LHQFPRSHFCEKVRWHLDAKGLTYKVRNLFPGTHARINRRLVGKTSVPLLVDGDRVIHDSSAIGLYLEATYPGQQLLPDDAGLRALVLALQTYFDTAVGPAVRHWVYGHVLRKRGAAAKLFFKGYSPTVRWTGRVLSSLFERRMTRMYPGDDASLAAAETALLDGIERLENTLEQDPNRYLVGHVLTLADVTAAALLAPVVGPPGSPWSDVDLLPEPVVAMRERLRNRVAGQWVLQRYARDRMPALKQLGAVPAEIALTAPLDPADPRPAPSS